MAENDTDLSGEEFEAACASAGLRTSLDRYLQSTVDKRVEAIISKKDNSELQKLHERINELSTLLSHGNRERLVSDALKKTGLSEKFLPFVRGDTPDEITASCTGLLDSVTAHVQGGIDIKLAEGGLAPVKQGTPGSAGIALPDIKEFAKQQNLTEQKGSDLP